MPAYEFLCCKCTKTFEMISSIAEYGRKREEGMQCPDCGSAEVVQQIISFQVQTLKKS